MGNHWFATYHPHSKDKLIGNSSQNFGYTTNCFYSLGNFDNLLAAFPFLAGDDKACTAILGLIAKKVELSKNLIYLLSHSLWPPSLFLNLTLASLSLLADYSSVKLTIH